VADRSGQNVVVSRPLRFLLLATAAAGAAALLAAGASAALWLVFSKVSAEPGETVTARTPGRGALSRARNGPAPRVFMAPKAGAETIRSVRDRRLVPLGRLAVDRRGNGRLRFAVPNLAPGDYTTFIHCPRCRRNSRGRALVPAGPSPGPFRIRPVLRSCSETQRGELPSDWASHAVHAGPVSLYPAPMPAPTPIPGRPGHFRPIKVLTVVAPASEATLLVPAAQRRYVRLAFAEERGRFWRPEMRVRDGLVAMTFKTCPEMKYPDDHFGGGFVVSRPMCAELHVQEPGREPRALRVPFGAPC
jgi:hypothetical protein